MICLIVPLSFPDLIICCLFKFLFLCTLPLIPLPRWQDAAEENNGVFVLTVSRGASHWLPSEATAQGESAGSHQGLGWNTSLVSVGRVFKRCCCCLPHLFPLAHQFNHHLNPFFKKKSFSMLLLTSKFSLACNLSHGHWGQTGSNSEQSFEAEVEKLNVGYCSTTVINSLHKCCQWCAWSQKVFFSLCLWRFQSPHMLKLGGSLGKSHRLLVNVELHSHSSLQEEGGVCPSDVLFVKVRWWRPSQANSYLSCEFASLHPDKVSTFSRTC